MSKTSARARSPPHGMYLDEGAHMETILDNLFQLPCDSIMEGQPRFMNLGSSSGNIATNHVIQEVFSIVDELAAIHDNMLSPFELKTCNLLTLH
jgi:hypothetical protein